MAFASGANAAVMSFDDRATFDGALTSQSTEDFNSFGSETSFASGSLSAGDLTLSMSGTLRSGQRNSIDMPTHQFSSFNIDGTTNANVLLDSADDVLTISFGSAVTAFGADFGSLNDNYRRTSILVNGERLTPGIVTGSNRTRFFGFTTDTAFSSVSFVFNRAADGFSIDNVSYGDAAVVPLPATLPMLAFAMGAFALGRRRTG